MDLFRFLRRPVRKSVPVPQPVQSAEVAPDKLGHPSPAPRTPQEIRQLLFDAVASGDESRLHALCKEHENLILQHGNGWLEVPAQFRTSPDLEEWYGKGLRAIREYCAERVIEQELTEGIRKVLDAAPLPQTISPEHER